ncbi:unnamed protein product [Phyllotreta striolata]|uniref:Uncharacterized protein n=1 Tax=Phyllotreta striolata TaxID=444603 RepID=A0A9N9TJ83_PHYSR|nr:unnamed protein product [Phyllotreta striolata]
MHHEEENSGKLESTSIIHLPQILRSTAFAILFIDEFLREYYFNIPQVNLYRLLTKFNGQTEKEYKTIKGKFHEEV